jgi:threonine dehydratase
VQVNFPEKAGALRQFLSVMSPKFNVTMFHYRSTGNRSSSVLLGLQVPPGSVSEYNELIEMLLPQDFTFEELDAETRELFDQFVS